MICLWEVKAKALGNKTKALSTKATALVLNLTPQAKPRPPFIVIKARTRTNIIDTLSPVNH